MPSPPPIDPRAFSGPRLAPPISDPRRRPRSRAPGAGRRAGLQVGDQTQFFQGRWVRRRSQADQDARRRRTAAHRRCPPNQPGSLAYHCRRTRLPRRRAGGERAEARLGDRVPERGPVSGVRVTGGGAAHAAGHRGLLGRPRPTPLPQIVTCGGTGQVRPQPNGRPCLSRWSTASFRSASSLSARSALKPSRTTSGRTASPQRPPASCRRELPAVLPHPVRDVEHRVLARSRMANANTGMSDPCSGARRGPSSPRPRRGTSRPSRRVSMIRV